jgi:hypothetical protein
MGEGCYDSNYMPITDCTCHSSCYNCGYYDAPTGPDDCITCVDPNVEVTAVYDDGTGYCGTDPGYYDEYEYGSPSVTLPDRSTFCGLWLSYEVCTGPYIKFASMDKETDCVTTASPHCQWDGSSCMMNSMNLNAWSDPSSSSGFVSDLEDVLYAIGCWKFTSLSTCDSSDGCMWDGNACKPTVTAVQSKMTATGANAAVSEYAVHEALEYVCPAAIDQATCEGITGCRFDDSMVMCGVDYEYGLYEVATACGTDLTSEDKELIAWADHKSSWAAIESMATGSSGPPSGSSPPTWPDLAAFCDLYLSYRVCDGNDEQACPTTSPYECTWDGQTGCDMNSADYEAMRGGSQSSGLTDQMHGFLSGDSGCGSLSDAESACNQNQNCTFSYGSCHPLVAAVNASMLSTGAHAAITEYAIADKRSYTCQTLDASTCSSVDGCQYYGCSGTSSANAASCNSRDGTTCEEYNCVWSDGTCSGNHMDCTSATTQFDCEYGLENNCHWSGCGSSSTYGIIRVATACGTEYDATDLDYIAQARGSSSWDEMISGSSGPSGTSEDVDFCMAWVSVTACDVADDAGATPTNCPSSLCEFVDGSSPTCTPTSASVSAWESKKETHVTSLLTACGQYDSSVDNCNAASEGCFYNTATSGCEHTVTSAEGAVSADGGTNAMQHFATTYTLKEAGYCASLSSTECEQETFCLYDGTSSSCVMVPNLDVAFIGGACEEVRSSSATVAAGLTGMLSAVGYTSFTELQETLMAGGGGRRRRRGPAAAWRGLAAAAAWRRRKPVSAHG